MRLATLLRDIADFCFPAACEICREKADVWPLCDDCLIKMRRLELAAGCERCGLPIPELGAPCPHCLGVGLRPYASVLRLCVFDDPMRQLVHRLKFHRSWGIGEFLAERVYQKKSVKGLLERADVIVPVPLHTVRHVARGYNQSEIIAGRLGKLSGRRLCRAVSRVVHTDAQTSAQSRTARIENLKNAFSLVDPNAVAEKTAVVVDDVRTTGATLRSIGRCLRAARPKELHAVVIAAADPHRKGFEKI